MLVMRVKTLHRPWKIVVHFLKPQWEPRAVVTLTVFNVYFC